MKPTKKQEKVERNRAIYEDKVKNKLKWKELIEKYNVCYTRIYEIIKREKEREKKLAEQKKLV